MSPSRSSAHQRLAFLDALRGFAALSVFIVHALPSSLYTSEQPTIWFNAGQFGVLLFFLISGFVIPQSIERHTLAQFWIRRLFRLYPIYWFSILIVIVASALGVTSESTLRLQHMPLTGVLLNFTMIQSLVNSGPMNLRGVFWTLAMEMLFYISATILVLLRRFSQIAWVAIGLIVLTVLFDAPQPWLGYEPSRPLMYLAVMMVGTVLYRYTTGAASRVEMLSVCGLCMFMLAIVPTFPATLVTRLIVLPFFGLMLVWQYAPRPLVYLGQISYSFYLLHGLVIEVVHTPDLLLNVIIWFVVAVAVSHVTFQLIERPTMNIGKRLSSARRLSRPRAAEQRGPEALPEPTTLSS